MKRKLLVGFIASLVLLTTDSAKALTEIQNYQNGRVVFQILENAIVQIPADVNGVVNINGTPFLSQISGKYAITNVIRKHPKISDAHLSNVYEIQFNNFSMIDSLIAELGRNSFIKYAEKKYLRYQFLTPNDPYYTYQWHLPQINAAAAWDISKGNPSVVVADVDGAILISHPDLSAQISSKSWDVADNDNNPNPPFQNSNWDHGTHTAGLIGAGTNNSTGVSSIGFGITIMAIKATYDTASNTEAIDVGWDAIIYAVDSGARVISCSWGGSNSSAYEQDVVNYAYNKGVLIVAAAGNNGNTTMIYPAAYTHVIAVASTGATNALSGFSDYGSWITLCAPGENILSTITNHTGTAGCVNGNNVNYYDCLSGTSMATPMVAGLAGLMLSLNPTLTPAQLTSCLTSSCTNISSIGTNSGNVGAGLINAQAALQCVAGIAGSAPVTNFVANQVTIKTGQSINFTDLSTNNPTSWSWTFTGAATTSSAVQNPSGIVYNTKGCYAVSLTATNNIGSSPVTKTCYITVAGSLTNECDTIANFVNKDTLTIYLNSEGKGNWGYVLGSNNLGDEANCDYFSSPPPSGYDITGAGVLFVKNFAGSSGDVVQVSIWDNANGYPSNTLANKEVKINTLKVDEWNFINFDSPVNVTGSYYLGIQFSTTNSPADTIAIACTISGEVTPNRAWMRYQGLWANDSAVWTNFRTAEAIAPILCHGSATGIAGSAGKTTLTVFPNPSTGEVNILYPPGFNEPVSISVYNEWGALVAKAGNSDLHGGSVVVNLSREATGVYYIQSTTGKGTEIRKIVLER